MTLFTLATIGGVISAVSTSAGSFLTPLFTKFEKIRSYHLSMDFALGVMLSAVAFSLVGPELVKGHSVLATLLGLVLGIVFILIIHSVISKLSTRPEHTSKYLLIGALIFHNFPEGMGAGASLAGMDLQNSIPIQIAISIQNVAEGLILSLLLKSMGMSMRHAIIGGVLSGFIEMSGAMSAGLILNQTLTFLPFLLAFAGGSMVMSVLQEMWEGFTQGRVLEKGQFAVGLITIPVFNFIFSY
jgi:zinc transporter, ZIP family